MLVLYNVWCFYYLFIYYVFLNFYYVFGIVLNYNNVLENKICIVFVEIKFMVYRGYGY